MDRLARHRKEGESRRGDGGVKKGRGGESRRGDGGVKETHHINLMW